MPASFTPFLASLWPDAQARGVSRRTFDLAFAELTPDPRVAVLTVRQPEYGAPVAAYLARTASQSRVDGAARKAREWKPTLIGGLLASVLQKPRPMKTRPVFNPGPTPRNGLLEAFLASEAAFVKRIPFRQD